MHPETTPYKPHFGETLPMTPEIGALFEAAEAEKTRKLEMITKELPPHLLSVYASETPHTEDQYVHCRVSDNYELLEESETAIINKDLPIILAPGYRERDYLEMAEWFAGQGIWVVIPDVRHEANKHLENKKAILGELEGEEQRDRQIAYELGGAPIVAARKYLSKEYDIDEDKRVPIIAISLGADNSLRGVNMDARGIGDLYAIAPFLGLENFDEPDVAPYLKEIGYKPRQPGPMSVMGKFVSIGPRNVAYRFTPEQFAGLMDDTASSLKSLSDLYKGVFHICARAALASDTVGTVKKHVERGNNVHLITSSKDNLAPTKVIAENFKAVNGVTVNESSTDYHPSVNSNEGRRVIMAAVHSALEKNQKIKNLALSA